MPVTTRRLSSAAFPTLWVAIVALLAGLSLLTPLYSDDYTYYFFNARSYPAELEKWYEPFDFYTSRFSSVSRFVPHLLVGLFTLVVPRWVLALSIGLSGGALCYMTSLYAVGRERPLRAAMGLIAMGLLWFVTPGFFQACLWRSGACNYLFVSLLAVGYILLLRRARRGVSWALAAAFFIFGFLTGWSNEGFAVALGGAMFFLALKRKLRLSRGEWCLAAGLWCGLVPLVFSPFNIWRFFFCADTVGGLSVHAFFVGLVTRGFFRLSVAVVVLPLLVMMIWPSLRPTVRKFFRANRFLYLTWGLSVVFVLLTGHTAIYSRFPVEIYALLLVCSFVGHVLSAPQLRVTGLVAGVATVIGIIAVLPVARANFQSYEEMAAQLKEGWPVCRVVDAAPDSYESRFVMPIHKCTHSQILLLHPEMVKVYYGAADSTLIIPRALTRLAPEAVAMKSYRLPAWEVRTVALPEGTEVTGVDFLLSADALSPLQRALRPFFEAYRIDSLPAKWTVIEADGRRWLMVFDNSAVNFRVAGLRVVTRQSQ